MSVDCGKLVKLVTFCDNQLVFDRAVAESLFMSENVKNNQVVLVTVLGKDIRGNTKLFSEMIHHLSNYPSNSSDDQTNVSNQDIVSKFKAIILECNSEEISIVTWSKPFFVSDHGFNKIAIFFLDILMGDGLLDLLLTSKDHQRKFDVLAGLCTHLASNVIHVEMDSIENIDWSFLSKFVGEGMRTSKKQHQKMTLVIRNWMHPTKFLYGEKGGNKSFQQFLMKQTGKKASKIKDCFTDMNCYLFPPFGAEQEEQQKVIFDKQFDTFLKNIFDPCYILPKKISNDLFMGYEIVDMIQDYVDSYENDSTPMDFINIIVENTISPENPTTEQVMAKIKNELGITKYKNEIEEEQLDDVTNSSMECPNQNNISIDKITTQMTNLQLGSLTSLKQYSNSNRMTLNDFMKIQSVHLPYPSVQNIEPNLQEPVSQMPTPTQKILTSESLLKPEDILSKYHKSPLLCFLQENTKTINTFEVKAQNSQDVAISDLYDIEAHEDKTQFESDAYTYAVDIAFQYYKKEINSTRDTLQHAKNQHSQISIKLLNGLKYACEFSSKQFEIDFTAKLRIRMNKEFENQKQNLKINIGIDLGMEKISVCTFINGKCIKVTNENSEEIFTSGIGFNKDTGITFDKLGNPSTYFCIQELFQASVGKCFETNWSMSSTTFRVEELIAMLLIKLKLFAESQFMALVEICVITVPIFFSELQKHAVHNAAQLAGFGRIEIIYESCAGAISYVMEPDTVTPNKFLVFIFGENSWEAGCYQHNNGQLILKSISCDKFVSLKKTERFEKSFVMFNNIIKNSKELAKFKEETMVLIPSTTIPSCVKSEVPNGYFSRGRNNIKRGAAIFAGLLGRNTKLQEHWVKATSSKISNWESVLLANNFKANIPLNYSRGATLALGTELLLEYQKKIHPFVFN